MPVDDMEYEKNRKVRMAGRTAQDVTTDNMDVDLSATAVPSSPGPSAM